MPSWKTGVTAPNGAVGYTWDASVPSGKLRDATNDAANYWNNIKNLHNGKVWFTSGSKVILKRGPLGGGIAAQTTWQGATIYITLSDSSDYNSLTQAQWGYLLAHEFGHVLNWSDTTSCSTSVTVMRTGLTVSQVPSLGSARTGDRCAYQSGYHQF